jgi:hypothetical protein
LSRSCYKQHFCATISSMKSNESGALNVLLIPLILASLMFFTTLGFALWAYSERTDYKNNSDQKADKAVSIAVQRTKTEKDNEFLEREKQPLRDYIGPISLGSFTMKYPKTWSAYSSEEESKTTMIFHPLVVPSGQNSVYALKVEVIDGAFDSEAGNYDNDAKSGIVKVAPFKLPKMPSILGIRVDGQIETEKRGSVVLLPLRDKTLKITTESEDFLRDFNSIILPNFAFQP